VDERELRCAICDKDMLFEVPPCADGHDDCPELLCTRCGAADLLFPLSRRLRRSRATPQQRRPAA